MDFYNAIFSIAVTMQRFKSRIFTSSWRNNVLKLKIEKQRKNGELFNFKLQ